MDKESKVALSQRLRRIEGQVRGIQAMIEEERECREILQQLAAVRSAVQSSSALLIRTYAMDCLNITNDEGESARQQMIADLADLISKAA